MSSDLLIGLAEELRRLVRPVERALENEAAFAELLAGQGHVVDPTSIQIATIRAAFDITQDVIAIAEDAIAIATADDSPPPGAVSDLIDTLISLIGKLRDLENLPSPAGIPADAWEDLAEQLLQAIIAEYVESTYPVGYGILLLVGIVEEEEVPAAGVTGRTDFTRRTMVWSRLPRVFSDTPALFDELYSWSPPATFRYDRATRVVARALQLLGLQASAGLPAAAILDTYFSAANPARSLVRNLRITLVDAADNAGNTLRLVLEMLPVPGGNPATPPGAMFLNLVPTATPTVPAFVPPPFDIELLGDVLTDGFQLQISPSGVTIPTIPGAPPQLNAGIRLSVTPPPAPLFGSPTSSRLEIDTWSAGLRLRGPRTDPEFEIELGWDGARLVIDEGDGDGFLQKLLPIKAGAIELGISVIWSSKSGLRLGGAGVEITLAIDKTFGPLELKTLTIGISSSPSTAALTVSAGVTIGLKIGPLAATVDRIGVAVRTRPVAAGGQPGILGDLDLAFGFKPPSGAGMSISAGPITGGGYIFFDPDNEQYAGILQLSFKAINIVVIGLLTTRLPDASGPPGATKKGFSLLLIVAIDLPPIALGYGFTLNGVGGLLGVNRTMVVDVLRDGVRNRTVEAILFPKDPIARASEIISTLRSVFPPAEGRFVFGPMVKIGWGPNSIIEFEAALVLELLGPIRLVILGRIQIALPDKKDSILKLRLDIVGVIDFDRGEISVDASLVDSKLLVFAITGDMSMRVGWGASKIFVLAAGGFNPRFQSPPGFPVLNRLAISLAGSDNPRIRLETYIALTSNTVQMGAALDFYVGFDTFVGQLAVAAAMNFDAMIQFQPFELIAELGASVDVLRNGSPLLHAALQATLTGPAPWRIVGFAEFECLGKHRVDVDATIGEPAPAPPVVMLPSELIDQLATAFARADAWAALPPADAERIVTVCNQPTGDRLRVHPLGALSARQRVLPFNKVVERFGVAEVAATTFRLDGFAVGVSQSVEVPVEYYEDDFAPGQFTPLTDDERLARPAFESMRSGGRVAVRAFRMEPTTTSSTAITYEESIVDDEPASGVRIATMVTTAAGAMLPGATIPGPALAAVAQAGAAGQAATRAGGVADFNRQPLLAIAVRGERYVAAGAHTLTANAASGSGTSAAVAHDVLDSTPASSSGEPQQVALAHEAA